MKSKFTGHDTFPLRYGWLYKAVSYLNGKGMLQTSNEEKTREAIVELGVGKNMVNAIRYWAEASSVIEADPKKYIYYKMSRRGNYLFGNTIIEGKNSDLKPTESKGKDPYLEQIGSIWIIHFWLNFNPKILSSYLYFFNYSNVQHFEKSKLLTDCIEDAKKLVTNKLGNENTLKKDIDCFLNTYCKKFKISASNKKLKINESHFTSPLSELNLIQYNGGGFYISDLTDRPELPIEIFIYGLLEFAKAETVESKINIFDFNSLLSKPYSPGRIFRLSEGGLGQKLDDAQLLSKGAISWIDTFGLRQIKINQSVIDYPFLFLDKYYDMCLR